MFNKKAVGIFGMTLVLFGTLLIQPAMAQTLHQDFESSLYAIGFIRINSQDYEINGFVLTGNNDGDRLFLKQINIEYDGTPIMVTNPLPFVFSIYYNPA